MRKTFAGLAAFCLFLCGCSKKEINAYQSDQLTTSKSHRNFYQLPDDASPALMRVAKAIQKADKQHPFSASMAASGNIPVWAKSKAMFVTGSKASRGGTSADTTVLVPVANDEKRLVTAFFACLLTKDTALVKFYQGNSYDLYPYTLSQDTLSANTIALQTMALHREVYGDSVFRLLDNQLLPFAKKDRHDKRTRYIKIRPASTNTSKIEQISIQTCYDIEYDGDEGQLVGTAPGEMNNYGYTTRTVCVISSVYIEVSDLVFGDGSTDPTSGGSGGGGSGGDPCGPTENGRASKTVDPGDCGGGPGWEPDPNGDAYRKDENGYYYARRDELEYIMQNLQDALLPCDSLNLLPLDDVGGYGIMWKRIANYVLPQYINDRIDSLKQVIPTPWYSSLNLLQLENATGPLVNCDFFPVRITQLPTGMTAQDLLEYFRKNINSFVDTTVTSTQFMPYTSGSFSDTARFYSDKAASIGALIHIFINGNSGSVIETDYYTDLTPGREKIRFKFSTIKTPADANHPVSGNREFGIYVAPARPGEYTFYTMGVDRTTDWLVSLANANGFSFRKADELWTSVQTGMRNFINSHGGQATLYESIKARPKWSDVADYLKGVIDFKTLKQRLHCF